MSRIGKQPVSIPAWVTVSVEWNTITVKGAKWELTQDFSPLVNVTVEDAEVVCTIEDKDNRHQKAQWGLIRSLIANMIEGVINGYKKLLEIHWVGYRFELAGTTLTISCGYSHKVIKEIPNYVVAEMDAEDKDNRTLVISGIDKQLVWEVAASIREVKKPEPYKGKGIRYKGEYVRRKAGKTAA